MRLMTDLHCFLSLGAFGSDTCASSLLLLQLCNRENLIVLINCTNDFLQALQFKHEI